MSTILKKLYAVVSYKHRADEPNMDEMMDALDAEVFSSKEAAVNTIIENMKYDLIAMGVDNDRVTSIMDNHRKADFVTPSGFWAIVFPFDGGDRGAIEMANGTGKYYRLREVYCKMEV